MFGPNGPPDLNAVAVILGLTFFVGVSLFVVCGVGASVGVLTYWADGRPTREQRDLVVALAAIAVAGAALLTTAWIVASAL